MFGKGFCKNLPTNSMSSPFPHLNKSEISLIKKLNKNRMLIFISISILFIFIYPFLFKAFLVLLILGVISGLQIIFKIEKMWIFFYILRYKLIWLFCLFVLGLKSHNKMIINIFETIIREFNKGISVLSLLPLWLGILIGGWVAITYMSFSDLLIYTYTRIKKIPLENIEKQTCLINQKKKMYLNIDQIYSLIISLIPSVIAIIFILRSEFSAILKFIIIFFLFIGEIIYFFVILKFY